MQSLKGAITIVFVVGIRAKSPDCVSGDNGSSRKILTLTRENATRGNLSGGNLLTIGRETFGKYQQLEELNMINSGVGSIRDKAFYDLPQLRQVNVSKNFISRLSSEIFRPRSKLWKLAVADNLLSSVDDFDVGYFPELALFDISNNKIRYLPQSLLVKLQRDENFTLITTNNPWDCADGNWSRLLNEQYSKFCSTNTTETEDVAYYLPEMTIPKQATFPVCVFWMGGAFLSGILIGNLCFLKRMICRKKAVSMSDASTQYEYFSFTTKEVHWNPSPELRRTPTASEAEHYAKLMQK